jgi:hypothetical protein
MSLLHDACFLKYKSTRMTKTEVLRVSATAVYGEVVGHYKRMDSFISHLTSFVNIMLITI